MKRTITKEVPLMTFGEKLHQLRREQSMSQETLARELDVSRQAISRWELGDVVPDTENVLAVSRLFGVSTDYLLRDDCASEQETPVVRAAEKSLKERQIAVGKQVFCRIMLLSPICLYQRTRLGLEGQTAEQPFWYGYLLILELVFAIWLFRLNWRYYAIENGPVKPLLIPDLLAVACVCVLPSCLEWVPYYLGLPIAQLAAVPFLTLSVKALRIHYDLPWSGRKWF